MPQRPGCANETYEFTLDAGIASVADGGSVDAGPPGSQTLTEEVAFLKTWSWFFCLG